MKVKQILAVILVVAFAMLAIPVSAAEPADTAISERRVELCGNCGGRMGKLVHSCSNQMHTP